MIQYRSHAWFRLLFSRRGSSSRGVLGRVLLFGAVGMGVAVLHRLGAAVHLPAGVHETGGALIALVLAFRVNTAYNRFWEGRSLWGAIVNHGRNLGRMVPRFAKLDASETRAFRSWIVVFAHAARRRLRGESGLPEVERLLTPEEFEALLAAPHPPLHAADELTRRLEELLSQGRIDPTLATWAERLVAALVDALGGCERIHKTPTPLVIVLLIERFIALYLATMPFMLVTRVDDLVPVVTMLIAYPVVLIDALAADLDDPFGHDPSDLPLTRICLTIERDLLGSEPSPELLYAGATAAPED
ncbi:MAG: hypothetical protein EPO40_25180 [Myxococcaceae bacterium]|nr:MAG: hypothetical protein EPO40_25180 [Myxococcaceae bacterium]